jgi:hypothetical protein
MLLGLTIKELATGLATVAMGAYLFFKWLKERRALKSGLAPNPTRCQEHAEAINKINDRITYEIIPDLKRIKDKLDIV